MSHATHLAERYLDFYHSRLSANTRANIRYRVNHWNRVAPDNDLSVAAIESYRNIALTKGYLARTIEDTVAVIRKLAEFNGDVIGIGRKLYVPKPNPDVPTIERIDALYRSVRVANWPNRLRASKRKDWWQGLIAIGCWTALRLGDLKSLKRSHVRQACITIAANKTSRFGRPSLSVPISPTIGRHLDRLDMFPGSLFGMTQSYKQLRRELKRIAETAGVQYVSPQGLRRFGINQWTHADSLAGQLIQGKSLGVMSHYLDVARHLASVSSEVLMPKAFYTDDELRESQSQECSLLACFRKTKPANRELILKIARELS